MVSSSVVRLAGFGWQAEVLPAYGMNLIRLARSGSELLRTPEGETQLRREPQVYQQLHIRIRIPGTVAAAAAAQPDSRRSLHLSGHHVSSAHQ